MRFRCSVLFVAICITGVANCQEHEFRTWRMRDGRRTRHPMTAVEIDGRVVSLKREGSDRLVRVAIRGLSDEDQAYLKKTFPAQPALRDEAASRPATTSDIRWPAPVVTDDNLEQWVTFIRPTKEDLKWRDIRWHNNLATAQEEARRLQRPILLWTMNGNPCGET